MKDRNFIEVVQRECGALVCIRSVGQEGKWSVVIAAQTIIYAMDLLGK